MPARIIVLVLLLLCFLTGIDAQPGRRFDTSMKIGKAGYKIFTNNKSPEKNSLTIGPIGFDNAVREVTIDIKGRINRAEVDDLNNDGFPDLILYVNTPGDKKKSIIIGVSSDKNTGFLPIYFPDILDDQKLRIGYVGYDEYSLMEGSVMRRFPVYNTTDTANLKPTGMIRQIQYRVVNGEKGELKFKIARSFDFAKQQ
jgi:hypothetical protein